MLVIVFEYRNGFLDDDCAMIEFFVYKMHGASGDFDAVGECLLLRFQSRKGGQKRRMNVQDAVWKLLHEPRREQAHISRETNKVDFVLLQCCDDFAVVFRALFAL